MFLKLITKMKIKTFFKNIALIAALSLPFTSCSEWLKVDMEDGIMEDALYNENEGFLIALNGIYTNLNSIYGSFWGMGALDVMAQYYNVPQVGDHPYSVYSGYNYEDSGFDNNSGTIWTNVYNLIANINVLIDHCDAEGSAISDRYYPIVKGEALALRAMLHFDLLRFYGPIYGPDTENQSAVPYLDIPNNKDMVAISTAKKVADKVLRDLTEAARLLENDPIRTEGVLASESDQPNEGNELRYRQYRLNYYAVQGLLARLYMWTGNKTAAYNCVRTLLTEVNNAQDEPVFPWVTRADATNLSTPDRLFSTEVMFALYNTSRESLFDNMFNQTLEGNALTFVGGMSGESSKLSAFYGENSASDYRRRMWEEIIYGGSGSEEGGSTDATTSTYFLKYEDVSVETSYSFRYMIPLMRISEMYLILAECTTDLNEAMSSVNEVRWNRNLTEEISFTEEERLQYIRDEFAREVIGEGQLFYFYKRHAMESIPSGTTAGEDYSMQLSDYVVPLPTTETDNRQ